MITQERINQIKKEFQSIWNDDTLKNMTLEQYVQGKEPIDKSTFCYFVERKSNEIFSSLGGGSKKFKIYYNKKLNKYIYEDVKFKSVEEAFKDVKEKIFAIKECAQSKKFEKLAKIEFGWATKYKICYLFSSNDSQLLNIGSETAIEKLGLIKFNRKKIDNCYTEVIEPLIRQKPDQMDLITYSINLYKEYEEYASKRIKLKNNKNAKEILPNDYLDSSKFNLNTIFYGPPGTGKTYKTVERAIEIIENGKDFSKISREELQIKYKNYIENGQIVNITFHQSYGYEEFIEGIRAITNKNENNQSNNIQYEIVDGIFKTLALEAKRAKSFSEAYSKLIKELANNGYIESYTKKEQTIRIINVSENDNLICSQGTSETLNTVNKKVLEDIYNDYINNEKFKPTNWKKYFDKITGKKPNPSVYYAVLHKLLSYSTSKNYVIIVDEINRGNISKIFGELITLIEDSKRIGNDEATKVKLPYSGKFFGVPNNLFIIGTMNTADRSITPIDTALRRRFIFEEIMPDPSVLKDKKINIDLSKLLEAINQRIEYLYDRDHTIGHTYFMNINSLDDLKYTFKHKIIPLLSEYFYEDWENIILILNDKTKNKFIIKKDSNANYLSSIKINNNNSKKIYALGDIDNLEETDFINIYLINKNQVND